LGCNVAEVGGCRLSAPQSTVDVSNAKQDVPVHAHHCP